MNRVIVFWLIGVAAFIGCVEETDPKPSDVIWDRTTPEGGVEWFKDGWQDQSTYMLSPGKGKLQGFTSLKYAELLSEDFIFVDYTYSDQVDTTVWNKEMELAAAEGIKSTFFMINMEDLSPKAPFTEDNRTDEEGNPLSYQKTSHKMRTTFFSDPSMSEPQYIISATEVLYFHEDPEEEGLWELVRWESTADLGRMKSRGGTLPQIIQSWQELKEISF